MPESAPPDARDFRALVRARIAGVDVDPRREVEIVDELAHHVAQHHADLVASGVADADALEQALAPLADHQRVAGELTRAARPLAPVPPPPSAHLVVDVARDLRYSARLLRRTPGFTAIAVIMLALGIGANTTIFSVLNAVLLRPLPYRDPERLVLVGERRAAGSAGNTGYTTFLDWRERSHAFEDMAVIRSWMPTLITNGEPERISGLRVSANFFGLLGVAPSFGRDFVAEDDTPARWRSVILSDGLWRRRFSADRSVIGRVITMNDQAFTIVGVMPPRFEPLISERFYQRAEMWALVGYDRSLPSACRGCQHLKAIARVKVGTPLETARADIDGVQSQLRRELPAEYAPATMAVVPLADELTGSVRPALRVLTGAVLFVLLIACANVASLLLARMARRQHDLAMRAALGASRARLVRQMMVESVLLAVGGGVTGMGISAVAVPALVRLAPATIARLV